MTRSLGRPKGYRAVAWLTVTWAAFSVSAIMLSSQAIAQTPLEEAVDVLEITDIEVLFAVSVLVYGLCVIWGTAFLIRRGTPAEKVIELTALVVIVTGTLFLIAAGFNVNDIAPAIGLLGTIAGYMLGRSSRNGRRRDTGAPPDNGTPRSGSGTSAGKRSSSRTNKATTASGPTPNDRDGTK